MVAQRIAVLLGKSKGSERKDGKMYFPDSLYSACRKRELIRLSLWNVRL